MLVDLTFISAGLVLSLLRPRWGFWCLMAIVIAYPQYLFSPIADPDVSETLATLPIGYFQSGLTFGLIGFSFFRNRNPKVWAFLVPITIFISLYFVVGYLRGNGFKYVVMESMPLLGYVTIACTVWMVRSEEDVRRLLQFLLVACLIACIGAIAEYILDIGVAHRSYYVQGRSAKGLFASFLAVTLIINLTITKELRRLTGFSLTALSPFFVIYCVTLVLTINRSMLFIYSCWALFSLKQFIRSKTIVMKTVVLGVLIMLTILILNDYYKINPALLGKFEEVPVQMDIHRLHEFDLLSFFTSGIDTFLLGAGAGKTWFKPWSLTYDFGNHNFYIQIIWKSGLTGIILLAWTAFCYFHHSRQRARMALDAYRGLLKWAYLVCFSFLLMGITMNRFFSVKHVAAIGFVLGLPYALEKLALSSRQADRGLSTKELGFDTKRLPQRY